MLGRIYMISSPNTNIVYIGSTFQTLEIRFRKHKRTRDTNSILIIDEGDSSIELLIEIEVIDKDELAFYEQQYLDLYQDIIVNKRRAFGRDEEKVRENLKIYYESRKDEIEEKAKEYREKHREYSKEKFECPCGGRYTRCSKSVHFKSQKHQKYLENLDQDKE